MARKIGPAREVSLTKGRRIRSTVASRSTDASVNEKDDTLLYDSARCEYISGGRLCRFLSQHPMLMPAREEFCINRLKNSCCYSCSDRELCKIGCDWRDETQEVQANHSFGQARFTREIRKCEERISRLAGLLADGKIGEQSYITAVKALESKINQLDEAPGKTNAKPQHVDK